MEIVRPIVQECFVPAQYTSSPEIIKNCLKEVLNEGIMDSQVSAPDEIEDMTKKQRENIIKKHIYNMSSLWKHNLQINLQKNIIHTKTPFILFPFFITFLSFSLLIFLSIFSSSFASSTNTHNQHKHILLWNPFKHNNFPFKAF